MDNTKIQWSDSTINFWYGCEKVSEGCKCCYMFRDKERYGQDPNKVTRSVNATFYRAVKWKESRKVFACSWSDYFIEEADAWREDAWDVIRKTPQHKWQILTKRPERIAHCLPTDWGNGYSQVWLGVSIACENEKHRLGTLQQNKRPGDQFLTFLSVEPLIGPLDFLSDPRNREDFSRLDWVIIGGESGHSKGKYRYRECRIEWIRDIIAQCRQMGIPVFVKQMGTHLAKEMGLKDSHGGDINEWPTDLQIREFPQSPIELKAAS